MRVLVTGATTPLGAAIVDHLLERDDVERVLAIAREPDAGIRGDRLLYRSVDLARARSVHDLVWGEARMHAITHVAHAGGPVKEMLHACAHHPTIHRFIYRSTSEVYARRADLIDEDAAIELSPAMPPWLRDRVQADLAVCAHLGGPLEIAVLRLAELVAPGVDSPLWDFLSARVCLRPIGFDPMLNALSLEDAAEAFGAALESHEVGVFNIPGYDTLPLSRAIAESDRVALPVPSRLVASRLRFGGVLDGGRARATLGYEPHTPVSWT
jgi:UDP-glucose 4-epimerase